jgi:hypothetical protein
MISLYIIYGDHFLSILEIKNKYFLEFSDKDINGQIYLDLTKCIEIMIQL